MRITLELAEAAHYGIGPEQIAATLEQGNRFLPTGVLDYGDKAVSIRAVSPGYEDLQGIRDTGIVTASGRSIRLADLAQVERVPRTGAIVTRVGNFPSTWLTMALEDQANVFRVREDMQAAIDAFEAGLDDGIAVHWLFDVEAGVDEKLSGLISNILLGVVILGGVLLIAIGWRSAFIVTSTLPVCAVPVDRGPLAHRLRHSGDFARRLRDRSRPDRRQRDRRNRKRVQAQKLSGP